MGHVLDLAAVRRTPFQHSPERWQRVESVFPEPDIGEELGRTFPIADFEWSLQRKMLVATGRQDTEQGRRYRSSSRLFLAPGEPDMLSATWRSMLDGTPTESARSATLINPDDLSSVWRALAADLLAPEYREAISEATGVDVRQAPMQAHFRRGEVGCWMYPHLDKEHQAVTHLLYFNVRWQREWGGCLRILGSPDFDDVVAEFPPEAGSSVILAPRGELWHGVPAIADAGQTRLSVQLWFWI